MNHVDRIFLSTVVVLTAAGALILTSASLGLLTRGDSLFNSVLFSQFLFGIVAGGIAAFIASRVPYRFWRRYAFYFFIFSILATLSVFIPHIGMAHGGARRWILIFGYSFQPSELLKIGAIIYYATWLSGARVKRLSGFVPLLVVLAIVGGVLLLQPDTDTFMVTAAALGCIYLAGGGKIRNIVILVVILGLVVGLLATFKPYLKSRIMTFVHPAADSQGAGYQIQQSLIAIGSGRMFGRGFGQSIQKFNFLPEPIGDSVFAVASEEFGFAGASFLIILFIVLAGRGFRIAIRAPDEFGRLLVVGIVILILGEAYSNIAAMLGILPLAGIALPFVSHGGSALFITLAEVGIILNVSRFQRK
jgi:cell division protein FtsW